MCRGNQKLCHGLASLSFIFSSFLFLLANGASGQNWFETSAPLTNWQCIASSSDGTVLAAAAAHQSSLTNTGAIYISTDSGTNWAPTGLPGTNFYIAVAMSADGTKFAALYLGSGAKAGVYYSGDSGSNWALRNASFPLQVVGLPHPIACSADGSKLVIAGGSVFTSTDAGITWITNTIQSNYLATVACSADGNTLAATTLFGSNVFVLTNSATTWSTNHLTGAALVDIAISADGHKMVAAGSPQIPGPIFTSSDFGSTWISNAAPKVVWTSVVSSADGTYLAAAASSISTVTNGGTVWTSNVTPPQPIRCLASSADGARVAVATGTSGLAGGIYILQSVRPPQLNITTSASTVNLSWIVPSTNFLLQQNTDPTTHTWTSVPASPTLNPGTLQNGVTLSPSNTAAFFRLAAP